MKKIFYLSTLLISVFIFTSCEKDDDHDHDSIVIQIKFVALRVFVVLMMPQV